MTKDAHAYDFATVKSLADGLLNLPTPAPHIWRHEVAKFLVSMMPRSTGVQGKLQNLATLMNLDRTLSAYFVKGYVFGIRG
jgi:hypothetical protein